MKNERVDIPEDQLEELVQSGEAFFGQDETVNMFDSAGNLVGVKGPDVGTALQRGFKLETNKQAAIRRYVDSKDNITGAAEVALTQFADEALFGIPELIAEKKGNPFEVEKWQALKEQHQIANTIGGLTGFGASFLVGGPVYKAGTAAGKAAEKVVANKLSQYGLERGAKNVAADLLARTAGTGSNLAIDAMVSSAPRTITEAALGDYEAAAESLLLNGGIGLFLGGAGGLAKGVFDRTKKAAAAYTDSLVGPNVDISKFDPSGVVMPKDLPKEAGATVAPEFVDPNNLDEVLTASGVDTKTKSSLLQELAKTKKNSPELIKVWEEFGINRNELAPDFLLESTSGRTIVKALENKPNFVGISLMAKKDKAFKALENIGGQILKTTNEVGSAFEIGSRIQTELLQKVDDALKAQNEVFTALNLSRQAVEIEPNALLKQIAKVEQLPEFRLSGMSSYVNSLKKAVDDGVIANAEDLAKFRTAIGQSVSPTSAGNDKFVARQLVDALDKIEERMTNKAFDRALASKKTIEGMDPITLGALKKQRQEANQGYRELVESLSEDADALGITSRNPYEFRRKIADLTAENFVKKFSVKNDAAALQALATKYPDQFELIRDYIKKNVYEKAMSGDRLNVKSVVKQIKDMPPEFAKSIFTPTELNAFSKLKLVTDAIPPSVNPPETGRMISYQELLNPGSLLSNASSYAQEKAIRAAINVEGILQTDKMINVTRSKLDRVGDVLKGLGKAVEKGIKATTSKPSVMGLERLFEDEPSQKKEREKELIKRINELNEKSNEFVVNPNLMINKVQEITSSLAETGAPTVATAMGAKAQGMIAYIAEAVPKPMTAPNVFTQREWKPSTQEVSQFERKMSVVANPFIVLDALEDSSLTKEHVEALAYNYPKLYEAIQSRIFDYMVKEKPQLPYQARLKLSLLMGTDVDNSLSAMNIKGLQDAWMTTAGAEQDSGLSQGGLMKLGQNNNAATETQRMMSRT